MWALYLSVFMCTGMLFHSIVTKDRLSRILYMFGIELLLIQSILTHLFFKAELEELKALFSSWYGVMYILCLGGFFIFTFLSMYRQGKEYEREGQRLSSSSK